jgi:bacterioferritin
MRAYPATAILEEMRSLRQGSDVTDRLDNALATKLVGVLRFRRHHFMAAGREPLRVAAAFLANSATEQAHADAIARRMVELGAEPTFSPAAFLMRSHAPFMESGNGLREMAQEGHEATRMAMSALVALARHVGAADASTRKMLLDIVAEDQARAKDLSGLAVTLGSA